MTERTGDAGSAPTMEQAAVVDDTVVLPNESRGEWTTSDGPTLADGALLAGRFRIGRVLGAGGMGTVYLARDESLGREVAIKLHHAASDAERLRREAVAMARLAHPNVVTVFEVGELDHHPFVVMEYVVGTTLRAWLAAQPHSVSDVLDVMTAVGEGLAAAHDAGLVHRDIKAENVLIGDDGRARVGDFGLARDRDSRDGAPRGASARDVLRWPVTHAGSVLGTPAYMAPEQFAGAVVDARADQWAYCVTLWEALWGARPFVGETFEAMEQAVRAGKLAPPPRRPRVRRAVRAVLERGLTRDPAQRFPSMRALLVALRRARSRVVLRSVGAVGGVVLLGALIYAAVPARTAPDRCADAGAPYVALVPTDLPARIAAAGEPDRGKLLARSLETFATRLRGEARGACEAERVRHQWSPELAGRSNACLEVAAQVAHVLLDAPQLTRARTDKLVERAIRLPGLEPCADAAHLRVQPALPADPDQRATLIAARSELEIALSELDNRELADARPRIAALATSPIRAEPTIAAGLVVARGALAKADDQLAEAEHELTDGYYLARAVEDDALMTRALTRLLDIDRDQAVGGREMWARTAVAEAARLQTRAPRLAAALLLALSNMAEGDGNTADELHYAEQADKLIGPDDPKRAQVWLLEGSVKVESGADVAGGMALNERAIAMASRAFGPEHPRIAYLLINYAGLLLNANRAADAVAAGTRALAIATAALDPGDSLMDEIRENLGAALSADNRDAEALPLLEQARAGYVAHVGEVSRLVAHVDVNLAVIYTDQHDYVRAIATLDRARATLEKLAGPDSFDTAMVLANLARAHRDAHDYRAALPIAQRTVAILATIAGGSDRHRNALTTLADIETDLGKPDDALRDTGASLAFPQPPQDTTVTAYAQVQRARALLALHRATEAAPLLASARDLYARHGEPERAAEAAALLPPR